jgi:hypothetical protein
LALRICRSMSGTSTIERIILDDPQNPASYQRRDSRGCESRRPRSRVSCGSAMRVGVHKPNLPDSPIISTSISHGADARDTPSV